MDDLEEFLSQQKALAEMPEGDIEDYEDRMRLRAKRRKLWRSEDEIPASPNQKEHEASELFAYFQALEPSHDKSSGRQGGISQSNAEEDFSVHTQRKAVSAAETRTENNRSNATDETYNFDDMGTHISSSHKPGTHLTVKERKPPSQGRPPLIGENDNDKHPLLDGASEILEMNLKKVSNNGMADPGEKVLRKRKARDTDESVALDTSNVTSPPNSPGPSRLPLQTARTLRSRSKAELVQKGRQSKKAEREREAAARKKEEELEKRMLPREYALHVQTKFVEYLAKTPPEKLPLRGKAIFYVGGDYSTASQSTRKKIDHLRKKGATVVPSYDPKVVTHIVTDASAPVTLKALGLKALDEVPMYIPTLTWNWVSEGRSRPEFWFAAFPSRIDATSEKIPEKRLESAKALSRGKAKIAARPIESSDEEYSRIEDFSIRDREATINSVASKPQDRDCFPGKAVDNDPLAEFYDQARKESREQEDSCLSDQESGEERSPSAGPMQKSHWTCDQRPISGDRCINQDIVDKLSELEEINKTKISGDPREQRWRVFSYGKSIRAIRTHPKRIRNYEDAIAIRGVGAKTARKIVEIIQTGDLERIKYDNTEDVQAVKKFTNIYGVGLGTAQKWYAIGCRSLEDARNRKGGITLSEVQEIGLKYYDDINKRIPRKEVEEIFNMIKSIALGIDPKLSFQLMGSYRRGAETCGDIDILMTRPTDDGKTHRGVLRHLLRKLHLQGILIEDLAIPGDFDDLEQTYRGLCRRDDSSPRRRIDILAVPYHERGGALIYYTGDDIFNRAIRLKAKSMGYSLSQHGLAKRAERDSSGRRMVPVDLIASETEEEIFRILGVPWQEPHERIRAMPVDRKDIVK